MLLTAGNSFSFEGVATEGFQRDDVCSDHCLLDAVNHFRSYGGAGQVSAAGAFRVGWPAEAEVLLFDLDRGTIQNETNFWSTPSRETLRGRMRALQARHVCNLRVESFVFVERELNIYCSKKHREYKVI